MAANYKLVTKVVRMMHFSVRDQLQCPWNQKQSDNVLVQQWDVILLMSLLTFSSIITIPRTPLFKER